MKKAKIEIKEITFDQFPFRKQLSTYTMWGVFYPAVYERRSEAGWVIGYGIRISGGDFNGFNWDYFETDLSGLIIKSPYGMARRFNKRLRIIDMPQQVAYYKDKQL